MATTTPTTAAPQKLPNITNGEICSIQTLKLQKTETKPPSRYTEGTLLDDMKAAGKFIEDQPALKKILREVSGLGTAATRAATLEGLKDADYLSFAPKSQTQLLSTPKARKFISWLNTTFPQATSVITTAQWEAQLSLIATPPTSTSSQPQITPEQFRAQIQTYIQDFVSAAKTHRSSNSATRSSSPARPTNTADITHSPNSESSMSQPSEKQLSFANLIASKTGKTLTEEQMQDSAACSKFIDENQAAALLPSAKQISFAESIAKSKGLTVPEDARANGRLLSRWIDDNKG